MKRLYIAILFFHCATTFANAQSGYIRFSKDSVVNGFIRFYTDRNTGEQLIEFWQTKNQEKGVRYHKSEIEEYGIGNERYVILRNFQPMPGEDIFLDGVETKIIESGTIDLMRVTDPSAPATWVNSSGHPTMVQVGKATVDVIRLNRKNTTLSVPQDKEKFADFMRDQFSDKALAAFEKEEGKLTPGKLRKFVKFYNEKTREKSTPQ